VSDVQKRMAELMAELMAPVDRQIMMCDDGNELLMMACAMLQRTKELFDQTLGEQGRKEMFKDLI